MHNLHDNKPNKRHGRGATGGGVAARGGFVGGIEGVRVTKGDVTTSQMRGMRGAVGDKSSSSCSCASINKTRKWGKDALVVSAGGDGVRAHLAASAPQL